VIGAGPRGTSVVERLLANAGRNARLDIHVIDPYPPGGGKVWRAGQPEVLLMNTLGGHATAFLDDSVRCAGPIAPGPTLFEWAKTVVPQGNYPPRIADAARELQPWTFPARALHGHYLAWVFDHLAATAPSGVRLHTHRARATELRTGASGRVVRTDRGDELAADVVILATGHTRTEPTDAERELRRFARRHGRWYAPPANPLDLDLDGIAPGETVLARGLGLNFFDCLALLTEGRGGRFERAGGLLRYRPSGREPVVYAGSRTGVPYRARPHHRDHLPPARLARHFTAAVVAALRARPEPVDFATEVWPLIEQDARAAHGDAPVDFARLTDPLAGRRLSTRDELAEVMVDLLRTDLAAALDPEHSLVKAATTALGAARGRIRELVAGGRLRGASHRDDLDGWFRGMAASLASGPPAIRQEQLLALVDAGLVGFVGPRMSIGTDEETGEFLGTSPAVGGQPVRATALLEARLPRADLRRTADPLLRSLRDGGQCRPYVLPDPDGPGYETGGMEVTEELRVVDKTGRPHRDLFAFGIPTESVHWGTAIGARTGANAILFRQSDAIARAVLGHVNGLAGTPGSRR